MSIANVVSTDILIIGGGPSGLATAIHLADLLKQNRLERRIMLIEKGNTIGSHILSGAVVCPDVFKELLPKVELSEIPFLTKVSKEHLLFIGRKWKFSAPFMPPYMGNKGNYIASLGEICRFLAKIAIEKGVEIYTGFAMSQLLYNKSGKVVGAKAIDTGVSQRGEKLENFQQGTSVEAKLTILAEGSRGSLTKQLITKFDLQKGKTPQLYSLGCKELWSVPEGRIKVGEVYNTMGFPAMNHGVFGGGFLYGLPSHKVALGLVLGLDYADPTFDIHKAFQMWKTHPSIATILKGGQLLEYGAKTMPEGGWYALPKLYTDNVLLVGDGAGFLAMPALKGIHLAIRSGMLAAQTAWTALAQNNFSEQTLKTYEELVRKSSLYNELFPVRNFRQGFAKGTIAGFIHFGTQMITNGGGFFGKLKAHQDCSTTKTVNSYSKKLFRDKTSNFECDKTLTFDKVSDVYYSGTLHDEMQVPHLQINNPESYYKINIEQFEAPCQYYCPAEVYELHTNKLGRKELRIHFENCLHCKTCDIKEPADGITWNVPNGGNGPEYSFM